MKRQAESLQLTNVCFLDAIPKRRVFDYLNQSHVALICTWDHQFQRMVLANKVFDYLAAGCPVVAAARGETEALLARAGCGWVGALQSSLAGLRRCSTRLHSLPSEELAKRGALGREYVRQHFLRSDLADRLQRTFAGVA